MVDRMAPFSSVRRVFANLHCVVKLLCVVVITSIRKIANIRLFHATDADPDAYSVCCYETENVEIVIKVFENVDIMFEV